MASTIRRNCAIKTFLYPTQRSDLYTKAAGHPSCIGKGRLYADRTKSRRFVGGTCTELCKTGREG